MRINISVLYIDKMRLKAISQDRKMLNFHLKCQHFLNERARDFLRELSKKKKKKME